MFIDKRYGLISGRAEYIALARADKICRERHKAENARYKPEKKRIDKKVKYTKKPPRLGL